MGQLRFASGTQFEVEDRALLHLERVILAKLRRSESCALTLEDGTGGHDVLWLSDGSILSFHYEGAPTDINRAWLELLVDAANSTTGLRLIPEP